ncbi:MAG: hypothetical protein IT258_18370 [Saprospiraceae bacterium]|nr:hypothetical protein [Saprospiraceae bacterium]
MIPKEKAYPVFEPNQVLKDSHLNEMFRYLKEQNHLTRTNLIGIGIVCGLELTVAADSSSITLSKGCGVTSGGHLIVVPDDPTTTVKGSITLSRYKEYYLPAEIAYPAFLNKAAVKPQQYDIWELFPTGEPDTSPISATILSDKVVVLFVECKLESLKNCSPNSCDDKGQEVTITLRKLLFRKSDMDKILDEANLEADKSGSLDIASKLTERIGLIDIRLRRFDVGNTNVDTADEIMAAYRAILLEVQPRTRLTFFKHVGTALYNAYEAYKPILQSIEETNPFADKLGTIQSNYLTGSTNGNIVFSQYYYDFLDDIIQAYEELKCKGLELMAMCCPSENLFERYLMVGEIVGKRKVYRHYFRPSMAQSGQAKLAEEVRHLFQRLVLMVKQFQLPSWPVSGQPLDFVKITPSKYGHFWLSQKAIPFYYNINAGVPALFERWSYELSCKGRERNNLSYNAGAYSTIPFVVNPLRYDLEPNNFFRVEGHIGRAWRPVISDLLQKIKANRLPIDVIALNADNLTVLNDPQPAHCMTNDLRIIYNAWVKEAACLWEDKIDYFTSFSYENIAIYTEEGGGSINAKASQKTVASKTVGEKLDATVVNPVQTVGDAKLVGGLTTIDISGAVNVGEGNLGKIFIQHYNDPKVTSGAELKNRMLQDLRQDNALANLPTNQFNLVVGYPAELMADIYDYTSLVTEDLDSIDIEKLELQREQVYATASEYYAGLVNYRPPVGGVYFPPAQQTETLAQLRSILKNCADARLKEIKAELDKRDQQLKEMIFFKNYVLKHPDIQHKAGVTTGGTLILVFREPMRTIVASDQAVVANEASAQVVGNFGNTMGTTRPFLLANEFTGKESLRFSEEDLSTIQMLSARNGYVFNPESFELALTDPKVGFPAQTKDIPIGVVIADFFVPYRCCSDCPPIQYVLPAPPPTFLATPQCTGDDGKAIVDIKVTSGVAPYQLKIDGGAYAAIPSPFRLDAGKTYALQLKDAQEGESAEVKVEIKPQLSITLGQATCIGFTQTFNLEITVSNGIEPFRVNNLEPIITERIGTAYKLTVGPLPATTTAVVVEDGSACPSVSKPFTHQCPPPPVPVAIDDSVVTEYKTSKIIRVLDNDLGEGTGLTVKIIQEPLHGKAIVGTDRSITYWPDENMSDTNVEFKYEITNEYGKSASATVKVHVNAKPCDLPCDGIVERCNYLLFLAKPNGKEAMLIETVSTAKLQIIERKKDGALKQLVDIDFEKTGTFLKYLGKSAITVADFDQRLRQLFEEINKQLEAGPASGGVKFIYNPENGSVLTVERYSCYEFNLAIEFNLLQKDTQVGAVTQKWLYNQTGINLEVSGGQTERQAFEFKKFGCIEFNKCLGEKPKDDCILKTVKAIEAKRLNKGWQFAPSPMPPSSLSNKYYWILEWGTPAFGDKAQITAVVQAITVKARFLYMNGNGCWQYIEQTITLLTDDPIIIKKAGGTTVSKGQSVLKNEQLQSKSVPAPKKAAQPKPDTKDKKG